MCEAGRTRDYAMVIDLGRCTGCWACAVACREANGVGPGIWWTEVMTGEGDPQDVPTGCYPDLDLTYYPVACQHCQDPPCVKVCPTGATYQRPDGIIAMDYDLCNGCRACIAACPYGARHYAPPGEGARGGGVVEKCDFCAGRVAEGLLPVCVTACAQGARVFGDLSDPTGDVAQLLARRPAKRLLAELGTGPRVYYLLRQERRPL